MFEQPLVDASETRAVVLMYHSFDRGSADLTVDGWQLDRQLTWLRDNEVEIMIVTTSEFVSFLHGDRELPARVAVVTLDDGDKSVYKVAWPVLQKQEAPFTLGLPTKLTQENKKQRMLIWDRVREMGHSFWLPFNRLRGKGRGDGGNKPIRRVRTVALAVTASLE